MVTTAVLQRTIRALVVIGLAGFCLPLSARGQTAVLNGFVTDTLSGKALTGANVLLRQEGRRAGGTTTDGDGAFILSGLDPGRYELRISYVGYQAYIDTLALAGGETRTVNAALAPSAEALEEVTVAEEGVAGAARVTAGHQRITPEDIRRVPTPDIEGDLASYLTVQPSIVAIGDRGGQLFIRGGEPSQNRVFLDGMPVYQPFHLLGFYSTFPAQIIRHTDIYAGGYPAGYNGGLSAVIDVSARSGHKQRYGGSATLSPFLSSARLEGPIYGGFSAVGSFRTSVLEQGAARYIDQPLPFVFRDGFVKIHGPLTDASRLSLRHLQSYDRGRLGPQTGGSVRERIRWTSRATGLRYLILPGWLPVRATLHLSRSHLKSSLGARRQPLRRTSMTTTRIALSGRFPGQRLEVDAGWSMDLTRIETDLGGLYQNVYIERPPTLSQGSLYLTPRLQLTDGLSIRPGLRLQFYYVRFDPYLEPRLQVVWERGIHHLSGAAGLYQQEIIGLSDRRDAASVFTAWTNTPRPRDRSRRVHGDVRAGRMGRAWHGILGYRMGPIAGIEASVEGYYKKLTNLYVAEWTAYPRFTTRLQPADGHSYGAEVRVELERGPFYGYLNYGLSFTRYRARQAQLEIWYGTEEMNFRPPHDRRHQVNLLASAELSGFNISARWAFGSGRPFSRALGFDGFRLLSDIKKSSRVAGSRRVIYERPFSGLLPTYHRLDVSLQRSFRLERAELTLQASVINAYDRRNIFYLDVFTLQRADQLPLVPSLGLKVSFN